MILFKKLFSGKNEQKSSIKETSNSNSELENDIQRQLLNDEKKIMLAQVKTYMTGHQGADAENAFKAVGILNQELRANVLKQYTWHYLDDMNENLQCTMQLVLTEVLEKTKPFTDSRDIYEKVMEIKYKGFDN
ncbi:hypothetical protein GTQ40_03025 [Flavobacteriaceae bacterium R38]|nr:hypothetical protein [Flavobacteriaceae bacterium R38]